jgi:hypothetical protein
MAGEEFRNLLVQVQVEAEAARNMVEYQGGRYEGSNPGSEAVIVVDTPSHLAMRNLPCHAWAEHVRVGLPDFR